MNNLKKIFISILILLSCLTTKAERFTYVTSNNDTLYFTVTSFINQRVELIQGSYRQYSNLTIPEIVEYDGDDYTVTSIGRQAFYFNPFIQSITIPNSVVSIDEWAFVGCSNLRTINIGSNVSSISDYNFFECPALQNIVVSDANDYFCSIDGVLYDKERTILLSVPAAKSGELLIEPSVFDIRFYAAKSCTNLTKVVLPENLETIGDGAFESCTSLESINFPKTLTQIGKRAFYNAPLLGVAVIPDELSVIGESAFENAKFTAISIGANVDTIKRNAFANCVNLKTLVMKGNPRVRPNNFSNCDKLSTIVCLTDKPSKVDSAFFTGAMWYNVTMYVPCGKENVYHTDAKWRYFRNTISFSNCEEIITNVENKENENILVSKNENTEGCGNLNLEYVLEGTNVSLVDVKDGLEEIKIYPNPATSQIIVSVEKNGEIFLYNMQGGLEFAKKVSRGENVIDVSRLSQGTYVLRKGQVSKLIIKQ